VDQAFKTEGVVVYTEQSPRERTKGPPQTDTPLLTAQRSKAAITTLLTRATDPNSRLPIGTQGSWK
jgi:hypothetical protein